MILKDKRIFVVEDNLENRVVYRMILASEGAQVEFERFGALAVSNLRKFLPVDMIILDLMLSEGVTGFDLCLRIRALPEFAHVPIVAVSAADPTMAIPKARQKGFSGFIAKPIDDELFPEQLLLLMNGGEIWQERSTLF